MASPVFRSAGTGTSDASSTVTVTKPASTEEGDLLIAHLDPWLDAGSMAGQTVTPPSDTVPWNFDQYLLYSNNLARDAVFWKIAGASEPANYTFTSSASPDGFEGHIICVIGPAEIAASPTGTVGTSSAADPPASGTVASGDYLSIASASDSLSAAGHTAPTNYTERVDFQYMTAATRELTGITSENPGAFGGTPSAWGAFTRLVGAVSVVLHTVSPTDDITTTGWTSTPLWSKIDEDPASPDATVVSATSS